MNDITSQLAKLAELKEKGILSQEEFDSEKAKLLNNNHNKANNIISEQSYEAPTSARATATYAKAKEIPAGVKGWSWGAFLCHWLWAIFNKTWIGLLGLIPFLTPFIAIILGIKGREWAWKNKEWDSLEHFNRVQKKWSQWSLGLIGGLFALIILMIALDPESFSKINTDAAPEVNTEAVIETTKQVGVPAPDATAETTSSSNNEMTEEEGLAEDAAIAAADAEYAEQQNQQADLARIQAETEAAKAKKEAIQAERELLAEQRQQTEEQQAQQAQSQQAQCAYSFSKPLSCASRGRQPTSCAWDFQACGNPVLGKTESKTSCNGKVSADRNNGQIIVTEGCRALFVPQQ